MTQERFSCLTRLRHLLPATPAASSVARQQPDAPALPQGTLSAVQQLTAKHLPDKTEISWSRTPQEQERVTQRLKSLLSEPLGMDEAIQVALLNNQGLQAAYAELGISEAQLLQASRLPNPGFGFAQKTRGNEVELERSFHFNLLRLLTLPLSWPFQASVADVSWLAMLGLIQLAIPCALSVLCAQVLKAPEVSLLALLEVIFGITLAWLGAGEVPGPNVLTGGCLVLLALVGNEWLGWRQRN